MKDKKIHTLVMTVFMQRTFTVLCFILLSVLTTLGATVTETFTVSSSTTVPSAGNVIEHTPSVSVQYGSSKTSDAINNEEIPTFSVSSSDDTYYIKRTKGTKKCAVNSSGLMEGVFFAFTPVVSGNLSLTLYNGHDSKKISYAIYTISNKSRTQIGSTSDITAGNFGTHEMSVEAGVTYYFHTSGTGNMGFAGYTFTYESGATDYSCLSVGSSSKTVSNKYLTDYYNCNGKGDSDNNSSHFPSNEEQLMDWVYNKGWATFKIKPTIAGNYLLSSVIGTKYDNRYVKISCNNYSKEIKIENNGSYSSGKTYEWIFENLEANKEYEVKITCTDKNNNGSSDGNTQVNILTTTIVKTDRKNAVETTTPLSVSDFNYNDETSGESLNRSGMLGFNITFGGGDAAKYNNTSSGVNIRRGTGTVTVALANTDADNGIKAVKFTGSSIQGAITASVGGTWSSASNNTITWTATEATSKSVTFTSKSDVEFKITKLDITTTDVVGGTKTTPVLAFQNTTVEKNTNAGTFTNTLTTTPQNFKVVYSFNNGTTSGTTCTDKLTGSTINTTTGEVTVGATAGQAQVIATFGGSTCFNAVSASYTLNVQGSEVVTPGGGTFNTNISSLTNQTSGNLNEETLGLNELTSAETFTVFRPTNNTDKFSNGAVIIYFNGYYYCMWQSSALDEDSQDTWVAYSRSKDGKTWDAPKALVSDDKNNNVINTSGGWYVDGKNNRLVAYINTWEVDANNGWTKAQTVSYKGTSRATNAIGDYKTGYTRYMYLDADKAESLQWSGLSEVKMYEGSRLNGIFEQDPYKTKDGRIICAAHFSVSNGDGTYSLVPHPIYTDEADGVTGWKMAKTFNIGSTGGMEPSVYQKPDGTTVMTFRTGDYKLASASTDNGDTWTDVAATNVPDAQTKQSAGNLPDGTSFLVGTPKKKSILTEDVTDWADANGNNYNTRQGLRKPLAILLSKDGTTFDIGYYLRKGKTDTDISSGPAYGGLYKRPGYHYAKSMVANGYLWISYATNKETVQVTRIPLSDISLNTFKGAGENARNIKLDFDNSKKKTHQDYVSWIVDTESSAEYTTTDAIKITVKANSDSAAKVLKGNRWGSAPTDNEGNLVGDGLTAYTSGTTKPTSGKVAIDVTITNLPAGTHTLQAYHNYVELNEGSVVPKINVAVNGQDVVTGVEQTLRKSTIGESAKSNVIFNVNDASDNTVITYYTTPENGVSYNCTGFFINSIEIDGTQVDNKVLNVYPKSLDFHTAHNNGNVILTWDAAPSGATKHVVYFGTDSTSVANGMCEATMVYDTSLEKYNLSPLKRYYWRVDEVIDGMAYEGEVQSFQPCRDAFPGAEGYGRDAIGGRGWNGNGEVYHVTSLKDDGSEGTFRYGIENATVPTTIVFDVAGVIRLNSRLTNSNPYVTIAGQTAPGNGIMFRGAPFGMSSDGITRFMRLRLGSDAINGESGNDGMGINGDHSIMDHCSIGWTIDEAFSSRGAKNITLQHTLISEALNIAWHPNYTKGNGHGYAATVGGDKGSLHHNLLAHNAGRNWSMGGGLDGADYYKDYLDMFNNVCYNWVDRTTDGGVHVGKFVGNYYKMGPSSNKMQLIMAHIETVGLGTQQYYVKGNIRENYDGNIISQSTTLSPKGESGTEAIYTMRNDKGSSYTADAFFGSEDWEHYFDSRATVETARAAFKNVLSDVGCSLPILDNHDVRMIGETLNGTYSTIGSRKGTKGIIDNENDSGCEGFGGLNIVTAERPTGWDSDGDGIPAWFETAMGWNDSDKNNNADNDGDYWTDLEEYLNWVAVPHFENMEVGEEQTIDLSAYFAGYGESVKFEITSNPNDVASISGSTLTVTPAKDMVLFTVKVKASESVGETGNLEEETISLEREFNFYVGTVVADNIIESEIVEDTELVYYPKTTETIEWSLTEGNGKNNYEVSKGLSEYLESASLTKGSYLSWSGTTTVANGTGTLVSANGSNGTSEDTKNSIVFNVQTNNGATLIPTKLSMYSCETNSTGVLLNAKADNNNGETSSIMNKYKPENKSKSWGIKYNDGQLPKSDNIDLNLYVLGASKSVGLRDVKITATLVHPSYSLLIMDEMAESNNLSNVTVKEGVDVKLIRNLTPNIWNTFCVPFDISEETIKSVWGEGTEVCEFTSVKGGNLHFTTVSAISAGTPCLIRPVNVAPSNRFKNVNVTQTEPKSVTHGSYSYVGTYTRYTMKTDGTELGLTSKNKLAKPKASPNNKMSGLRAFFRSVGGNSSNAKVIIGGELTSIDEIDGGTAGAKGVYHVSGRYVRSEWNNGSGLPRGLYIVNGQKMVK